jgi:hypothetical protein
MNFSIVNIQREAVPLQNFSNIHARPLYVGRFFHTFSVTCEDIETGCSPESVRSVLACEALRPKGRGFPVR